MDVKNLKQTIIGGLCGCATALFLYFVFRGAYVIWFELFQMMHNRAHELMK